MMKTEQKRAQRGGETGTNGEFYEGGKFLPSTRRPKGQAVAKAVTRKQEVAPYKWEVPPAAGLRSLFGMLSGSIAKYDHATGRLVYDAPDAYLAHVGLTPDEARALVGRWNAGDRWNAI
jgi:hypothetical protein